MTVYVDQIRDYGVVSRQRGLKLSTWAHMTADTERELHEMAARLRLKRTWFQGPPKHRIPHYDVTPYKRQMAISYGAVAMDALEQLRRGVGPYARSRRTNGGK